MKESQAKRNRRLSQKDMEVAVENPGMSNQTLELEVARPHLEIQSKKLKIIAHAKHIRARVIRPKVGVLGMVFLLWKLSQNILPSLQQRIEAIPPVFDVTTTSTSPVPFKISDDITLNLHTDYGTSLLQVRKAGAFYLLKFQKNL